MLLPRSFAPLCSALLLAAFTAPAFAQVNHGNFPGTGVTFVAVTETTATAGDPAVLWGAPSVAGSGLLFFPPNFSSTCAAGTSDITSSLLSTDITAAPGNTIESIGLVESGDVTLIRLPPPGTAATNASASLSGFVTVLATTSGPISPVIIPFTGTFVPSSTFALPGSFGTKLWSGSMLVDVASQVPNATLARLSLDNTLSTNCATGSTSGKIQKKVVSGPSVALIVNPVECELSLEKTCCVPTPVSAGVDLCEGKVKRAVFEVVGGTCADTNNAQDGKAKCTGTNPVLAQSDTVDIAVTYDADKIRVNGTLGGTTGVPVGSTIELTRSDGSDFSSTTKFSVSGPGGVQLLEIHTSCSQSLSCGDQFGSVRLVELETTEGGTDVCPDPDLDGTQCTPPQGQLGVNCTDRPASIVFQYTGEMCQNPLPQPSDKASCSGVPGFAEPISVVYTGKDPAKFTLTPNSGIDVGETFTFTATGRDELHSESSFVLQNYAGTLQTLKIHTSCSQPLRCGDAFGALKIVGYTQKDGVVVSCNQDPGPLFQQACQVPLAPPTPHCTSKVMELELAYIGDLFGQGCSVSNSQGGNASCTGVADPGSPVSVTITRDADQVSADPNSGINEPMTDNVDVVSITRLYNGAPKELAKDTEFTVSGPDGSQALKIRTSCSKPLNLGDRFGSFAVVGIDRADDGHIGLGGQVEFQYTVTNNSTEDAEVDVTDDPLGTIATDETVGAGQTRTFFATRTLFSSLTNEATVMGATTPSGAACTPATDTLDVEVLLPPQGAFNCSDAKPLDELSMVWNPAPSDPNQNVCIRAYDGTAGSSPQLAQIDNVEPGDVVVVAGMGGSPNDQQWRIYAAGNCGGTVLGTSEFHISCSDSTMNGVEDCGRPQGNGKDDSPALADKWLLEGMRGSNGKQLDCTPAPITLPFGACGLGFEVVLLLPGLTWLRRRLRRA